jgi:hypothetical protein
MIQYKIHGRKKNILKLTILIGIPLILFIPASSAFLINHHTILISDTIFTIEDPPVDFEVIDAEPFDGYGDNGPFAIFNDVLLGTLGECRSCVEFDISNFSIPPGEVISASTLEVVITEIEIYGLGVNGTAPESLAVDGYIGNGVEELSDFEAGNGNVLDSIAIPDPQIGQILSFNITSFVTEIVTAGEQYVGLTIRAETFGGLWVTENEIYPKLTIETVYVPEPDLTCAGSLSWTKITPGDTVSGVFQIGNIGETSSMLSWEITSWPEWGTWTFTPDNGTDVETGAWRNVSVTVVAPDEENTQFTGNITIRNVDNSSDFCTLPVSLKTPVAYKTIAYPVWEKLQQRFPLLFTFLCISFNNHPFFHFL